MKLNGEWKMTLRLKNKKLHFNLLAKRTFNEGNWVERCKMLFYDDVFQFIG